MHTIQLKKSKNAIAMIELIFALVIMGIVLLSAPMLIQQSIRSGNVALQQEAIALASSHTGVILSMNWDEENANLSAGTSPILDVNRTVTPNPFIFDAVTHLPFGLNGVSGRLSFVGGDTNKTYSPSVDFNDIDETGYIDFDDIDDYNASELGITVYNNEDTTSDIGDYIDKNLTMKTLISYIEDRPSSGRLDNPIINDINMSTVGGVSNIKFIHVHLTSDSGIDELNKSIVLEAFSCNIGTYLPQGVNEL